MSFPILKGITPQVTLQVRQLISIIKEEMTRQEIQDKLNLSDRKNFIMNYLQPALEVEVIEMTIPDNPRSSIQRYKLTRLGKKILEETKNK